MPLSQNFTMKNGTEDYVDIPQGLYTLEISDITDKLVPSWETRHLPEAEQEKQTKLEVQFTILDDKQVKGQSLRGRRIWKTVSPVYAPEKSGRSASNLYLLFNAVGDTPTNVAEKDLKGLVGKQVQGVVKMKEAQSGKSYAEVSFESLIPVDNELEGYFEDVDPNDVPF